MNKFQVNKFEYVSTSARDFDLPVRATKCSAGYDFHSPEDFIVNPGEIVAVKMQVKAQIREGQVLLLFPRSSLGWKYNVRLVNTVGVIDADYYNNPDNEGEIGLKMENCGDKPLVVHKNDRLIQGIFVKFDITDDDQAEGERLGGFGSTNKEGK